jgi:hypothetical protein
MKRTQIQLPDELFAAAREVSDKKEISFAELVRRGLEYMVAVTPRATEMTEKWELPPAYDLGGIDPFLDPDWREKIHMERLQVAEEKEAYGSDEAK